jgi:hypothetical protein
MMPPQGMPMGMPMQPGMMSADSVPQKKFPVAIVVILVSTFTSEPVLVTGVVLAVLVGLNVATESSRPALRAEGPSPL